MHIKMRKHIFFVITFFITMLTVVMLYSCKPGIPSDVIGKSKMEDILYDYHIALAAASQQGADYAVDNRAYTAAVLKKYDVTENDFEHSMQYYSRHIELLNDIYKDLAERLENEADEIGASMNETSKFGSLSAGDTIDVWNGNRAFVLSVQTPFNLQSFDFKVDTTFHKGDRVMLDFESQFIFQDGVRDGLVMLAVTFGNDSVAQMTQSVNNSQPYSLSIDDRDSLGFKSIRGFFILNRGDNGGMPTSLTTLKLMLVKDIHLYRMHMKPLPNTNMPQQMPGGSYNNQGQGQPPVPQPQQIPQGQLPPQTPPAQQLPPSAQGGMPVRMEGNK